MVDINVLGVAHQANPEYIKWVWWYSILEDKFEGYDLTEVEKHTSSKFTLANNDIGKYARGKVVLFKGYYYLLIWTPGYKRYAASIIERILEKINQDFIIDYVIDESGQLLYDK